MDIQQFLAQTEGKWFSQRTNYDLQSTSKEGENSKADLSIEILPLSDSRIPDLSQQYTLNSELFLGGMLSTWDNAPDWGKPKQTGFSLLIFLQNSDNAQTGEIVKILNKSSQNIIMGNYLLANDQSLTLSLVKDDYSFAERIWFGNDNLRMRTNVSKYQNKVINTSFYSEIRKIVKPQETDS